MNTLEDNTIKKNSFENMVVRLIKKTKEELRFWKRNAHDDDIPF
jgi:hypothetical protein